MPNIRSVLFSYEVLVPPPLTRLLCSFSQVQRRPEVLCWGGCGFFSEAPTRHTASTSGLACKAAGPNRVKIWRGLGYVVRDAEFGNCARSPFETQISSRSVVGLARCAFDGGSRGPEAAEIRLGFRFGCLMGLLGMSSLRRRSRHELHHHVAPLAPHTRPKPPPKTPPKTPTPLCALIRPDPRPDPPKPT
jgi:hypothetical protein